MYFMVVVNRQTSLASPCSLYWFWEFWPKDLWRILVCHTLNSWSFSVSKGWPWRTQFPMIVGEISPRGPLKGLLILPLLVGRKWHVLLSERLPILCLQSHVILGQNCSLLAKFTDTKKNQGFIVPSPLILKAPPRNHALVGDLHVFGNIEWGCFSYEQRMRPATYLGVPKSKAPSPEDLEVWKRVISASWQLWGSPLVEKNGVARS